MERLGQIGGQEVQFPGWLMVELFGPVVFFGNTYPAIPQDGFSGVSAEEKQWKYDDQHDFFKKQPDKSCHSTGLKGTCSTIQLWC